MSGDHDRVDRLVRRGGVSAAATDGDREIVYRGEDRTGSDGNRADGEVAPQVHAERRVDGWLLQEAVGDHRRRPGAALLGGLEGQLHRTVRPRHGQALRHREAHGHVSVVPAGVHHPVDGGPVWHVVRFMHAERVHVGAHQHHTVRG